MCSGNQPAWDDLLLYLAGILRQNSKQTASPNNYNHSNYHAQLISSKQQHKFQNIFHERTEYVKLRGIRRLLVALTSSPTFSPAA